ncbi:MAG: hypothetical protein OXP75_09480 [Rhodospirillales bacterium]|nr:hypothetical protein [Rhodospirillales bacterium]
MKPVAKQTITRATDDAIRLWALASGEYPLDHKPMTRRVQELVSGAVGGLAVDARRCLESLPPDRAFTLRRTRWRWKRRGRRKHALPKDFREVLDRILDAARIEVQCPTLPESESVLDEPGFTVLYLRVRSDGGETALIDVFALSHCFLTQVLPALLAERTGKETVH